MKVLEREKSDCLINYGKVYQIQTLHIYSKHGILQDIKDPSKGFIKDNKVNLKIDVAADAPHGVQ